MYVDGISGRRFCWVELRLSDSTRGKLCVAQYGTVSGRWKLYETPITLALFCANTRPQ